MAYEWFNNIDQVIWHFEECVERAAGSHRAMLGMAPSAGDEARARLRKLAQSGRPLEMIKDVEDLNESDVRDTSESLAAAAVEHAADRGSRHVTREDVAAAIDSGGAYPYIARD